MSGAASSVPPVYGAPPSRSSSPASCCRKRETDDGDEVTSPIWISSHGLDLQLAAEGTGTVTVRPKFAVYIRVFPTEEDLKRPDCRLRMPILSRRPRARTLKDKYKAAVDALGAPPRVQAEARMPEWKKSAGGVARCCASRGRPGEL